MHRPALSTALTALALCLKCHADGSPAITNFPDWFPPPLQQLVQSTNFVPLTPGDTARDWKPDLQLLVAVTAVDGGKRSVHLVELTTLPAPLTFTNGQPWQPALRTNDWSWSPTNKAQFITTNYPVRVRVYDAAGQMLKEGQVPMAWGSSGNGLFELCRLGIAFFGADTNSVETNQTASDGTGRKPKISPEMQEPWILATGSGFLWMFGMFQALQTVPTVADVWSKAQCAIRKPGAWTITKAIFTGISIELAPQTEHITVVTPPATAVSGETHYRLPVELKCDGRVLCHAEITVGPAHGAEMLLDGVQRIHAQHPTKSRQEFLAQVIAAGTNRNLVGLSSTQP